MSTTTTIITKVLAGGTIIMSGVILGIAHTRWHAAKERIKNGR